MTEEALYMDDSYLKEFDAKVVGVKDEKYIILDKTAFYPTGGGQPCDYGTLTGNGKQHKVINVKKITGNITHELEEPGLLEGEEVHGTLNWERRYKLMRMHTAAHLLSAVFHTRAEAKITGNQLGVIASHWRAAQIYGK